MVLEAEDRVLVAAARRGDLDAFEVLVRRHQTPIYRLALRMLGSHSDAQDVAQEAFIQAWRSLARFRGDSSFSTWMHRIAVNRGLNHIAARRSDRELSPELTDVRTDPAEIVERSAQLAILTREILALSPDQRAALVLRELQGLSYEEVAQTLGVSLAAVKGRIHRARLALAEAMDE